MKCNFRCKNHDYRTSGATRNLPKVKAAVPKMNSEVETTSKKNSVLCNWRSKLERRLILLVILLSLITLILFVILATIVHQTKQDANRKICLTTNCIQASSDILKYMDFSVDPCDDFYQFACGNFLNHSKIPEDKIVINSFTNINDIVKQQLKTVFEEPSAPDEPKPFKMLKEMYNLCMNTVAIEADGLNTVKAMIKQIGGWPVLEGENWNENKFDWKQYVYKFRKVGFDDCYFITIGVVIDSKNSSRHIILLDQPEMGLSREYLIKGLNDRTVKTYYNYLVDIAVIFGANPQISSKEMKETLEFEIKLANITSPREKLRNKTAMYNHMTVKELQVKYPTINWLEYLINILNIPDIEITYDEEVVVAVPEFLTNLEILLSQTPKRVLANYVTIREVITLVTYLTKELRNIEQEYYTTEIEQRWRECITIASSRFHLASGFLYVDRYFQNAVKTRAKDIVLNIRTEFIKLLKEVDWMDDITKKSAIEKASSMTTHVGYPDELLDVSNIEKYYENVEINSNYLKSITSLSLFKLNQAYKKLRKPVSETNWSEYSYPSTVNAFYSPYENSIHFPAAILQGNFFDKDLPNYLNYGGIGYVIGHEIIHGFDDEGRQYDKDGHVMEWWAEGTKKAFMKKVQCIVEQYRNYNVQELNTMINGINTQGENIADNGGIKVAYLAYNRLVDRNGPEPCLPGLNYTSKQLFWISAAHSRCAKSRKQVLKFNLETGYHSPERFRIVGPLSNTDYFAKDFNCSAGSRMNPVEKCRVW